MLRGEIRLVELDPVRGSEANGRRPAVIVSNDRANATAARLGRGVVTVVPVTSNTDRIFPFQTLLPAASTGPGKTPRPGPSKSAPSRSSASAPSSDEPPPTS